MHASAGQRVLAALASLLVVTGAALALVFGFALRLPLPSVPQALETIVTTRNLPQEREPPPPPPRKEPGSSAAKESSSPPNLRDEATSVFAPSPRVPPLIMPPPIIAAPEPDTGDAVSTGAADRAGPGRGSGGRGEGHRGASKDSGYGSGQDFRQPAALPRQIRGRLRFSDLPRDLRREREGAELTLRYRIGIDGAASDCRILVSSGRPELDAHTCRYITEHFRFRPARDERGRPVPYVMTEIHGWDAEGG
jgi:protein TonB